MAKSGKKSPLDQKNSIFAAKKYTRSPEVKNKD